MGSRLPRGGRLVGLAGLALAGALLCAVPAWADAEQDLAAKYAPVVRLVEQTEECGPGEPYRPMDVDRLFGDSTVALRGPWNATDLVKIGPTAKDLAGLYEYHLDFPGSALDPGCDYEKWARRLEQGSSPTIYAHVATDPTAPGKLALQYWFFYAFNDFNNTHEGDWEMIQLVFDAADASEALRAAHPTEAGYSSHEGAERATWGDEKLDDRRRHPPRRLPGCRLAREQVHVGPVHRQLRRRGRRLRRHPRAPRTDPPGRPHHPERSAGCCLRVPVDHLRGPVGRAAAGVLQRADRAEPQDAVDGSARVGGRLARPQLRGPDGRPAGHGRDRFLLHERRARLLRSDQAPSEPGRDGSRPRAARGRARVRDRQGDMDTGRPVPGRKATRVGPDPLRLGPDVRRPPAALSRARRSS